MNTLKVGIFMGGMSVEKEVSFNSGRTVYDHIDKNLFEPILIFQNSAGALFILPKKFLYRGKIEDFENRLETEAQKIYWNDLKHTIDFAFIAMHGRFAEDGILQGMLELLQIPYLGAKILGSALARDKFLMYDALNAAGVRVPLHYKVTRDQIKNIQMHCEAIMKYIPFPCIVKPHREGSSFGVSVAHDKQELIHAIHAAAHCTAGIIQPVIVEEKINGREFVSTVIMEAGVYKTLPPTEVVLETGSAIFDYDQKYMPGRTTKFTPARFKEETINRIQQATIQIMKTLSVSTLVRVDGFVTESEDIIFIDVNTITGMAPSSFFFCQAAEIGLNHAQLINMLIKAELDNYKIAY